MKTGDVCWLEDGSKAEYVGEFEGRPVVRIFFECGDQETGWDEAPSHNMTVVDRVFHSEPNFVQGPQGKALEAQLAQMREEKAAISQEITALKRERKAAVEAAAKYPQFATALNFLEGRISHVVVHFYGTWLIKTLGDALEYKEDYGKAAGMKLLCLFGVGRDKKCHWSLNNYPDGSGSWTIITPFASLSDAEQFVNVKFNEALEAWRRGEKNHGVGVFKKNCDFLVWPDDWLKHEAEQIETQRAAKVEKLRAELAELECSP